MYSLFEEAITAETETMNRFLHQQDTGFAEAEDGFLPDWQDFSTGLEQYLDNLRSSRRRWTSRSSPASTASPPAAGLPRQGAGAGRRRCAGAQRLLCRRRYRQTGAQVEDRYLDILRALKAQISIPINMKLSPASARWATWCSASPTLAPTASSLFNRFYQPDINIDSLRLQPSLHPSTSAEALLAMRWIAILYGRIDGLSLGATGGIHTPDDAIKLLLAGTDVVHLCSTLLKNGAGQVTRILTGLDRMDGGTELRVHRRRPRPRQRPVRAQSRRLRARQLRQHHRRLQLCARRDGLRCFACTCRASAMGYRILPTLGQTTDNPIAAI
jgi:dihydroorotate dehydrogenase (fumarate)